MKRLTSMMIAIALTLVCDRAFNHGALTLKLYDNAADARDWAARSTDEITATFTGFHS
ncbi:hypothetical protein [Sphingomonas changbaiensis]|nr:hypothetical protein [Sphingomonas changbaiensis]